MGQTSGLDGLGLLGACGPIPAGVAIVKANVVTNGVPSTQYLLVLSTATGAHVTYWTEEALAKLRDQITTELTGLIVAADVPPTNGDGYGN